MAQSQTAHTGLLSQDGRWRWDGSRWQPVRATAAPPTWASRLGERLLDFRVARAADWWVPAGMGVGALAADAALRAPRVGLAATVLTIAVCAWLVLSRRVAHGQA